MKIPTHTFRYIPMLLLWVSLVGCASVASVGSPRNGFGSAISTHSINWPLAYRPEGSSFHISNQRWIAATPEQVWEVLIDAERWPEWYAGASEVRLVKPRDGRIGPDSMIEWKTMGLRFKSKIHEFEPPYRLGWESRRSDIQGYHAWLIIPTDGGSLVITEEAQLGFLAHLQRYFQPNRLYKWHEVWIDAFGPRIEELAP